MFKWFGECVIEVELLPREGWDFCMNPSNWSQWTDEFESFSLEGDFKTGSTVIGHANIRNSPVKAGILLTDVQPFTHCSIFLKSLLSIFTQTSSFVLQPISQAKSLLIIKTCVTSLLVPFMKKFFLKRSEKLRSGLINSLSTIINPKSASHSTA